MVFANSLVRMFQIGVSAWLDFGNKDLLFETSALCRERLSIHQIDFCCLGVVDFESVEKSRSHIPPKVDPHFDFLHNIKRTFR